VAAIEAELAANKAHVNAASFETEPAELHGPQSPDA
jgi:hypothetical protein